MGRIDLVSQWSGEALEPNITGQLPAGILPEVAASQVTLPSPPREKHGSVSHQAASSSSFTSKDEPSSTSATPSTPHVSTPPAHHASADAAAVSGTNDGSLDWREAHEDWTAITGLTLSPRSFGERVLAMGGGKKIKRASVAARPAPSPLVPAKRPSESSSLPYGGLQFGFGAGASRPSKSPTLSKATSRRQSDTTALNPAPSNMSQRSEYCRGFSLYSATTASSRMY